MTKAWLIYLESLMNPAFLTPKSARYVFRSHFMTLLFGIFFMAVVNGFAEKTVEPKTNEPEIKSDQVIVIPIDETVDYGLYAFLKRSVAEAVAQKPRAIVFKINTFGGELKSAFDIVDLLTGITACSTYAYVEQKAISAGALIALSCNRIVMQNGTTIGDCAPITQSQEGIVMLGEKIQSPLRAKFRNLAERNGYPSLLSQAMVTADLGVVGAKYADSTKPTEYFSSKQWESLPEKEKKAFATHRIIVQEGQLLTLTDKEASQLKFSQGSYASLDAFLAEKKWTVSKTYVTTWSEKMVRVLGSLAPILMLIGFGALYLEFKTPGLSVFGIIGFLCLVVVFGSKYAVGLADYPELLLLVGGFILFMAEMWFFPGTFILAGLGIALMVISLVLSLQSFTLPDPKMPWELKDLLNNMALTLSMAVGAMVIPLFAFRFLTPWLPNSAKVISDTTLAGTTSLSENAPHLQIGQNGVARTGLRPTGKAAFGNTVVEVQSRSEFIEAGTEVSIIQIKGNLPIVKPIHVERTV